MVLSRFRYQRAALLKPVFALTLAMASGASHQVIARAVPGRPASSSPSSWTQDILDAASFLFLTSHSELTAT